MNDEELNQLQEKLKKLLKNEGLDLTHFKVKDRNQISHHRDSGIAQQKLVIEIEAGFDSK